MGAENAEPSQATTATLGALPPPHTIPGLPPKPPVPRTDFPSVDEGLRRFEERTGNSTQFKSSESAERKSMRPQERETFIARAAEAEAKTEVGETVNWVGRLTEYRAAHPRENGLLYTELTVGSRFRCNVKIIESIQPFGGSTLTFSNKKDAKRWAAKKAVDWLVGNGFMPEDGSVRFPSTKAKVNPATAPAASLASMSAAAQVPDMCHRLSIVLPTYKFEKAGDTENLYNGYALFEGVSWIDGPVGEFENILGRKQAKEVCAEKILSFLRDIERHRNESSSTDEISTPVKPSTPTVPSSPIPQSSKSAAATRVPEFCTLLGLRLPTYVIEKASESEGLPLYNGFAHFESDPRLPLKIGEFKGVYGKKNAKERCAEMILEVLLKLEKARRSLSLGEEGETPGKRKRQHVVGEGDEKKVKHG